MQILSVHLKNIKSHRDRELRFTPGINVLSGRNGIGKSTVFEAIGYALFGVDACDFVANVDRFLSIGAKKGEVVVRFRADDDETYQVSRTVGGATRWLLAKQVGECLEVEEHAAHGNETETRLKKLLGLDNGRSLAEQFKLVIGPFQDEFLGPFVIRQATRRQEAFDKILGIDAWRTTFKGTASLVSTLQEKIRLIGAEVAARQEQIAVLPLREKELTETVELQQLREAALKERREALQQAAELMGRLEEHKRQMDAAVNAVAQLKTSIDAGREHCARQQVLVGQAEAAAVVVDQHRPGKEAFERAELRLAELRGQEKLRRVVEAEVAALEKEAERLAQARALEVREVEQAGTLLEEENRQLHSARAALVPDEILVAGAARLPDLRKQLDSATARYGLLGGRRAGLEEGQGKLAEGQCPFLQEPCGNFAGEAPVAIFSVRLADLSLQMHELGEVIGGLEGELQAAERARQELAALTVRGEELDKQASALAARVAQNQARRVSLEKLEAGLREAASRAMAARERLHGFATLDDDIVRADKERADHQAFRDLFHANLKDADDLENRRLLLAKYHKRLDDLLQELAVRQAESEQLCRTYEVDRHDAARRAKESLVAEVATLGQQLEGLRQDRLRLERELARLRDIQGEIAARLAEVAVLQKQEKLAVFLRTKVFKNVSAQLSERFREEITLRGDRIYRAIAENDEELVWDEGYRITLRDLQDGQVRERSDDQLSGGQMMTAVVALRLALLQTIGARIAFFDEPTSNLDSSRRENLAQAFRAIEVGREEVTEHWYDQLFLISHDVAFTEITEQTIHLGEPESRNQESEFRMRN